MEIGACLTITRHEQTAGTITVTCHERETTLSHEAATALMTQESGSPAPSQCPTGAADAD
ncbi:MAG: hypothetical protein R3C56_04780 [Pirellulaceae bacterium]